MRRLSRVLLLALLVGSSDTPLAVSAAATAGRIDALSGSVEVRHGENGEWTEAVEGAEVVSGDQFRTGRGSRIRVGLEGGSSIELTGGSELSLDRFERTTRDGRKSAILRLTQGAVRVKVSDEFRSPRSKFELETPTAIATVHGTEFVVVFDPTKGVTNILGISNTVEVQSTIGVVGPRVNVEAFELSRIETGKFPTTPRRVNEETLERYRQAFHIVAEPAPALIAAHPGIEARVLRPEDVPDAFDPPPRAGSADRIRMGVPREALARHTSPDFDATGQPIPEFFATPPGIPPSGGVEVDF